MAKSGNYPIRVYAGKDGKLHIGAGSCKNYDASEKIYGSQIPHRVVVKDKNTGKHELVTPTEAMKNKDIYKITDLGYTRPMVSSGGHWWQRS
jgi:hypothetical protein